MANKALQRQQLNNKMLSFINLQRSILPPTGWIHATRTALGMTMQQLGKRLSITKQSVQDLENREKNGSITLRALKEAASALDMHLVYGFLPIDGNLEDLIERKAKELAMKIVLRTSNSMKLEDQENSKLRIEKAIEERTAIIKSEMPKSLWD